MSSGTIHATASLAAGVGLVAVGHYDLTPAAMVASALVGGMGPDIDRGTSLAGGLVPQWLAPDVPMRGGHGRKVGPFRIPHRGPTHSLPIWLILAVLMGLASWHLSSLLIGIAMGVSLYVGAFLHIVPLDRSGQWLWPLSPRWFGVRRG